VVDKVLLDWLVRGLAKPGKTQKGLAAALEVDPSAITRLVQGERDFQVAELPKIAGYIGEEVPPSCFMPVPVDGLVVPIQIGRPALDREDDGLAKAIAAVGSLSELARRIGLSTQAVSQWQRVPPERCLDVERVSGVSRYVLRPDVYGLVPAPGVARAQTWECHKCGRVYPVTFSGPCICFDAR
jgi:DNA-binding transcriptional regulator YdaS (Cro superfamily)